MAEEYTPSGATVSFTVPEYEDVADGPQLAKDMADDVTSQFSIPSRAETLTNKTITTATLGSNLAAGGFRITGLGNPTNAQDAATKNWAETAMSSQLSQATTQATNAAASASSASTSAAASAASATASQASRVASETARTGAEAAQSAAATSASNAASSATSASGSASTATTQAASATASAASATASAASATASQAASAASESASATSASNAASSASSASTSATNSANSATASANSAAASQASRVAAETAQGLAEAAKTDAETAESNAATSESNASLSAQLANDWATKTSSTVAGGEYSAKYHAQASATSASAASSSASTASTAATNAAASAVDAASSAAAAATALDSFDDRYLGAKSVAPTVDNDGNALIQGALFYLNAGTAEQIGMYVFDGSGWLKASAASVASIVTYEYTATASQTVFTGADNNSVSMSFTAGLIQVFLNGVLLNPGDDYTTTVNTVTLTSGAAVGDSLTVVAFASFNIANTYTTAQADATFLTQSTAATTYATKSELTSVEALALLGL